MAEESGFRIASAYVEVTPDASGFKEKLQADLDEAVSGVEANVKVGLDTARLDAQADDVRGKVDQLDEEHAEVTLSADIEQLRVAFDEADAKLAELDGKRAEPEVGLARDQFDAGADAVTEKLAALDTERAEPTADLDTAPFEAKIAQLQEQITALKAETASAGGESGGGLFGAITMGIGSLLPGLGGAAAGLGLLAGTGLAAFGGIGKALSAHSQASQNVGITSQQTAATAFANAVAVQQAQQAISQAYAQSAEQAQASSMAIIQANQQVGLSEQSLKDSQFSEQQAQVNLTNARIQARLTLQQLNDAEKDSVLATQAAKLALAQAQYQQNLTDQNAMSTSLDRQQAALAVAQAQQQVTEAQQNQTNSAQAADRANKLGVNGSQQVVQAEHAVLDAVNAVKDARQAYADAIRNAAFTQQQAAYQQKQADIAVQQAVQNLSNTIREQRLQQAATMSTSNQAATQYARDMARLSAPAREFVKQLLSMHGAWKTIEDIAQGTVLPGMTIFLKGVKSILPEIDTGVRLMGKAMGTAFGGFGKLMQTSAFKEGLAGLLRNGVQFANIVLPAFAQFLQQLGQIGGKQGAVSGLANLLAGIAHGLTGLAAGLRPYIGDINAFLESAGHIIAAVGPPLASMIGLVARALTPLTHLLNSHPNGTITKVLGDIGGGLLALKGLQKILPNFLFKPLEWAAGKAAEWGSGIAKGLGKSLLGGLKSVGTAVGGWLSSFGSSIASTMSNAASSVASFVSSMGSKLAQAAISTGAWIAEHAIATAAFIAQNLAQAASATAAFVAENAATLGIGVAIAGLIAVVIWAGTHWHQVWTDIKKITLDVWHDVIDPMWHGIATGAKWLYDEAIKPVFDGIKTAFTGVENAALWLWHNVFDPVWHGIMIGVRSFESGFSTAWSRIEGIFKTPVNFLIGTVYDNGIRRFWNDIVGHIGLGSLKLPEIPKLAHGGIVPGRDTGRDNRLVAMRSGEGVLVPEAVQAIGPGTVHALNNKFGGGGSRSGDGGGGFKKGGILGDIGGFFTSLGRGLLDSAEWIADPVRAITGALGKLVRTPAGGDLGKVMTAIPKTLITDLASLVTGGSGTGKLPGGGSGAVGSLPSNWKAIATFLASHGFTKFAAAGVTGNIDAESGGNPEILEVGGGGGGGLIQWTPYPPGYITGNAQSDLMTQLNAILSWGGGPGLVNKAKSPSNAALLYQDYYERPANLTASLPQRMASANAVYKEMGWGSYDSGGWLMPSGMPGVNQTGQPEAVLTPSQSGAVQALARWAEQTMGNGTGAAMPGGGVNFNYFGTMYPSVEQRALMRRDLALAMSGGTP